MGRDLWRHLGHLQATRPKELEGFLAWDNSLQGSKGAEHPWDGGERLGSSASRPWKPQRAPRLCRIPWDNRFYCSFSCFPEVFPVQILPIPGSGCQAQVEFWEGGEIPINPMEKGAVSCSQLRFQKEEIPRMESCSLLWSSQPGLGAERPGIVGEAGPGMGS